MEELVFEKAFKETRKKFPHIQKTAARIIVQEIEKLNVVSRQNGTANYFRNNQQRVLRQYQFSAEERKTYASLSGRYFSAMKNIQIKPKKKVESGVEKVEAGAYKQLEWTFF